MYMFICILIFTNTYIHICVYIHMNKYILTYIHIDDLRVGPSGAMYQGPFVSDLRLMPIKSAIQFLLRQLGMHLDNYTNIHMDTY
jgi:hypothetical protein